MPYRLHYVTLYRIGGVCRPGDPDAFRIDPEAEDARDRIAAAMQREGFGQARSLSAGITAWSYPPLQAPQFPDLVFPARILFTHRRFNVAYLATPGARSVEPAAPTGWPPSNRRPRDIHDLIDTAV